jgi:hypothetical protein
MLTSEQLTERRTVVEGDIGKVEEALKALEGQRVNLQANLYALQGALQQIDYFLKEDNDETPEWDGVDRRNPEEEVEEVEEDDSN